MPYLVCVFCVQEGASLKEMLEDPSITEEAREEVMKAVQSKEEEILRWQGNIGVLSSESKSESEMLVT